MEKQSSGRPESERGNFCCRPFSCEAIYTPYYSVSAPISNYARHMLTRVDASLVIQKTPDKRPRCDMHEDPAPPRRDTAAPVRLHSPPWKPV